MLVTDKDTHISTYSDVKRPVTPIMVSPRIYHTRKQNVTTNEQVPALNSRDLGSKHRFLQSFVNAADNEQEESGGDFIQHVRSKSLRCYVGAMM